MKKALGFIALLLCTNFTQAQWYERETSQPVADSADRKSSNGFGAALILTNKPDAVRHEWDNTPSIQTPKITTTNTIRQGETITAMLLFGGCGKQGSCQATVNFKLHKPDNTIDTIPGGKLWQRPTAPTPTMVNISDLGLGIKLDADDPLGQYTLEAFVQDPESKAKLALTQSFKLVK